MDNLPPAYSLVIKGQQSVVLILVKAPLEGVVGQFIDVLLEFSASTDVLGWNAYGVLSSYEAVHIFGLLRNSAR